MNGIYSKTDTVTSPGGFADSKVHPRWIADVDGDGYGDVIATADEGVYISFFNYSTNLFSAPIK